MLQVQPASKGLLFASFLYRSDVWDPAKLVARFEDHYGKTFFYVPNFNPLAKYYAQEMGEEGLLKRFFLFSTEAFPRENLLTSKLLALAWENEWALDGKRSVNVDTGFLTAENFLLATTKNYSHRVYIGENIYSDLTYYFHMGQLQTLPWTYPDYLDEAKLELFTWLRMYLVRKNTATQQ